MPYSMERNCSENIPSPPRSRGYTLIELLVSIAIMAIMFSMAVPALQQARRAAQSAECRSRLAQVGMAFHTYHQTHGSLPAGSLNDQSPVVESPESYAWGWALSLLPQLGEQNLLARLNRSEGVFSPGNAALLEHVPARFRCPGSTISTPIGYAGSYDDHYGPITNQQDGVLYLNSHLRWSDLVDGLHQTIMLGEARDTHWGDGTIGSLRSVGGGFGESQLTYPPGVVETALRKSREEVRSERQAIDEALRVTQVLGDESSDTEGTDSTTTTGQPGLSQEAPLADEEFEFSGAVYDGNAEVPPPPPQVQRVPFAHAIGFWPAHRDGGHFLLADGSVRLISRSISMQILQRLAHRSDHAEVSDF